MTGIDPTAFRHALGSFVTGVTIVTTLRPDGEPIGLTANSFNSVSLDPPLVLWSLNRASPNLAAFEAAGYFAINILAAEQMHLSQRFARHRPDKFDGVPWQPGIGGTPLIDGVVAQFCCRHVASHDGGDHIIFIGEVEAFTHSDRRPLVFAHGRYMDMAEREPA
ncbi:MAG TPA: flavin reductase family protein [Stellaceae bacterium]|jgi:flavin reductase (DIM6/NTAB) family NADH-FMN oxidoreductase RutF|nr:flavin reductase family protein [Stellaceae bacterium]